MAEVTRTAPVLVSEDEFRAQFEQVMRAWDFAPYREGRIRPPERDEIASILEPFGLSLS